MTAVASAAIAQRSMGDPAIEYPLWPPLTSGCPKTSTKAVSFPVEVTYDYEAVPLDLFQRERPSAGPHGWAPLLPPLDDRLDLGIGDTPLLSVPSIDRFTGAGTLLKDESRNLTWSHKDRLNLCTISAAALTGAPGVVVASSGNHGASAAALSARLGLPCVVITSTGMPPAIGSFLAAYGAAVIVVEREARWQVLRAIVSRLHYHPVSNLTTTHTGHPFGVEGYKTIAYELFLQLDRTAPEAVFVPTGYGELLYGVHKGFAELRELGLTSRLPRMYACEPAARAPLARALDLGLPATTVASADTSAYAIGTTVSGYRSTVAVRDSGGQAIRVTDEEMAVAQRELARAGMWQELSASAGVAGLRQMIASGARFDGPIVCLCTSSGFKDKNVGQGTWQAGDADWTSIRRELHRQGLPV
ncbi:pyridoxal-phosphate dependent enzyme [Nonomuraea sp. NPDC049625]|uniref:threonine synthase n=1 Tax=Nonomuraea sp. NPDC049625 TaxID=3155775 RepID=UPI00343FFABE